MKGVIRYTIVFMDRILYFDKNDSMTIQTKDLISTFLMKGVIRYTTVFMGRLARRQALSSSWQFDCNCLRCQVNTIHPSILPFIHYVCFINSTFLIFLFQQPTVHDGNTDTLVRIFSFVLQLHELSINLRKNIMIWRWRCPINCFHC